MRFDYLGAETLTSPAQAAECFDEDTGQLLMHGGSGITLWYGPAIDTDRSYDPEEFAPLRIDVDSQAGRAAIRWLPDRCYVVEFEPIGPIEVFESDSTGLIVIPQELARVSVETARRAVSEYVATGQRPTGVTWVEP
jgi:hypothetical protein